MFDLRNRNLPLGPSTMAFRYTCNVPLGYAGLCMGLTIPTMLSLSVRMIRLHLRTHEFLLGAIYLPRISARLPEAHYLFIHLGNSTTCLSDHGIWHWSFHLTILAPSPSALPSLHLSLVQDLRHFPSFN